MMTTRRSTTKYTTILFFHIKKINNSIFYILGCSLKCKIDRTISLKGKEAYFSTLPFLQQILSCLWLVLFFTKNNFLVGGLPSVRMLLVNLCIMYSFNEESISADSLWYPIIYFIADWFLSRHKEWFWI